MPQLLKRWEDATVHLFGQEIRIRVKAPSFSAEPEFNRRMVEFGMKAKPARAALAALASGEELPAGTYEALFDTIDQKWAASIFEGCVRVPEPISLEGEEEAPITDGAGLFAVANGALVMEVLNKVSEMSRLGAAEGKASSSPSTSGPAGKTDAGASPAMSTVTADGPAV
jgi:hypothetical protein